MKRLSLLSLLLSGVLFAQEPATGTSGADVSVPTEAPKEAPQEMPKETPKESVAASAPTVPTSVSSSVSFAPAITWVVSGSEAQEVAKKDSAKGDEITIKTTGEIRFRWEHINNRDFNDKQDDMRDFFGNRYRLGAELGFQKAKIFVQPQYAGAWGDPRRTVVGDTSYSLEDTAGDGVVAKDKDGKTIPIVVPTSQVAVSSGQSEDPFISMHQAYFLLNPNDLVEFKVGRQEITYGEDVVIGRARWNNAGRAFDAAKFSFKPSWARIDLFYAKILEQNWNAGNKVDDKDMYGMYTELTESLVPKIKELHVYAFHENDRSDGKITGSKDKLTLAGSRLKTAVDWLDVRSEHVAQTGDRAGVDFKGYLGILEVGATYKEFVKSRISAEFSHGSKDYNQFYATPHRVLGFVDLYGRRNIQDLTVSYGVAPSDTFKAKLDYHSFMRVDTTQPLYNLRMAQIGDGKDSSRYAGSELDLVLNETFMKKFAVEGGACLYFPGGYTKSIGSDMPLFFYLQTGVEL